MENMDLALTLLLAGFLIVFAVLILLIFIIAIYGKIIQAAQKKSAERKQRKAEKNAPKETVQASTAVQPAAEETLADNDGEIPDEIIAVIAAAVDAVYGGRSHKIKSVKRSRNARSAWGNAGVIENTRPF